MTFTASSVWMVRNGGSDANNGGGFDRGVSGMASDGSATSATGSAPVFSSSSYNFVAGDVGHWVYIKSGTNWIPGWYLIASVAANAATLTAGIGTVTMNAGGLNPTTGCATTASPSSATWSVDYSRKDASQVTYTDLVINAGTNTNATSAANPLKVNQIGNVWNITSGTGFTVQRATLVSISGVTGTFDRSLGTLGSTGGNGRMGGAFASPGMAASVWRPSNWIYIKYNATAYSTSSTSSSVSGGYIATSSTVTSAAVPWEILGFDVTPGDATANRPTFKHGTSTSGPLVDIGDLMLIFNMIFDGNVGSFNARGVLFTEGVSLVIRHCKFTSFGNNAMHLVGDLGSTTNAIDCEFTACATAAAVDTGDNSSDYSFYACVFHDNTIQGVVLNGAKGGAVFTSCIFDTNKSGSSFSGLEVAAASGNVTLLALNCVFYNSGASGISLSAGACSAVIINCIFETNGAYGVNVTTSRSVTLICNAFYNNSSGQYPANSVSALNLVGNVTATASTFTDAANGDFTLNSTVGGGPLCKAVGDPTTFLPIGAPTSNYLDLGAAQVVSTFLATKLANAYGA